MGMNVQQGKKRGMVPTSKGVNTYRGGMGTKSTRQMASYKKPSGNCNPKSCGYK